MQFPFTKTQITLVMRMMSTSEKQRFVLGQQHLLVTFIQILNFSAIFLFLIYFFYINTTVDQRVIFIYREGGSDELLSLCIEPQRLILSPPGGDIDVYGVFAYDEPEALRWRKWNEIVFELIVEVVILIILLIVVLFR